MENNEAANWRLLCRKVNLAVFGNIKPFISRWLFEIARYDVKLLI
jgi:hypothetical protein